MRRVMPLLLAAVLAGCSSGDSGQAPVIQYSGGEAVLRVNEQPVVSALLDEVARGRGLDLSNPEQRQAAIKELSDYVLLANYARRQGYDKDPQFNAAVEAQRLQGVANATVMAYDRTHPIADQVVKAEYDEQVAKAGSESYDFSQILFASEADALKAAEGLLGGKDWAAVYAEWKDKAKQAREFTDVRLIQLPAPELISAIKNLKPGDSTKVPVKTQYGWHLLHLSASKPVSPPAFADVSAELRRLMLQRQSEAWMQKMRTEAVILDLKSPKGSTPGVPGAPAAAPEAPAQPAPAKQG
ncbi:peptidylprolyl isomerase [Tahibacter harae]|uniref:peptidylprolyl isomerase n=1 Tax=Tahibacter harae TaxID=2963937 RepID=A0ABT1QRM5_9GAMM|nr:peptidylprolyl isomerase [Tahibacter harae]MCQ4164933.1 peptidylprolyl isomerase [Tahibacter harae]